MTIRNTLLATAVSAALLAASPALASDPRSDAAHDMTTAQVTATSEASTSIVTPSATMGAETAVELDSSAAIAPMLEQKSEDLLERADALDDAGMNDKAIALERQSYETAVESEAALIEAELETGKDLKLESVALTEGDDTDTVIGEDATILTQTDATTPVIETQVLTLEAPSIDVPSVSAIVGADTEIEMDTMKIESPEVQAAPSAPDM